MLPPIIRKLIPCLASEHPGEAIAARDAIGVALRGAGKDWHDLGDACFAASPGPHRLAAAAAPAFGDMARACRDLDRGTLSPRERSFVLQMCALGFGGRPSPRQADWLATIFARVAQREAA